MHQSDDGSQFRDLRQTLCIALATHFGARTKLQLPLVLVLLAPLKLACLKGLTTDDDLKACVLIGCAGNPLKLTLGDRRLAAEPSTFCTCKAKSKECKDKCFRH